MNQLIKVAPQVLLKSFFLVTVAYQLYAFFFILGPFKIVLKQLIQAAVEKNFLAFFLIKALAFSILKFAVASNIRFIPLKKQFFSQK